jgi:hypothetical protein
MTCEPCTYSQEQEADSLPTSSLDTRQLSLLSGMDMPAKSCESEPPKDGSPNCTCGKGMSDCSIHPNTPEKWIASMRDSLARICQSLESRPDFRKAREVAYTEKLSVLLAQYDPATSSLRTCQQSLLEGLNQSWPTWPRWGSMRNGAVYEHPIAALHIEEIGGGYLPTPSGIRSGKNHVVGRLDEWGGSSNPFRGTSIGKLRSPSFEEWMMGWPMSHTVLTQYGTDKSRSKQPPLGNSLEASK